MRAADADILIRAGPRRFRARSIGKAVEQRRLSTARRIEAGLGRAATQHLGRNHQRVKSPPAAAPVICVAHSLGVVALLHAAERCGDRIAGAFLVAPPSESVTRELPAVDGGLLPYPRRRLAFPALLVGSRDDPYAEPEFAARLAADLGAQFVDAGAAGHITVASGHGRWPKAR